MIEDLDLSNAKVKKVVAHRVGNKFRDEGVVLSHAESAKNEALEELLLKNFLNPVINEGDECILIHESDINLNTIKHYSSLVFEDQELFFESSLAIAKHLYSSSTHPNIIGGEFIEVLYDGIKINGKTIQAIGLFRIEKKHSYLDVENNNGIMSIIEKNGISVDSIQKGAVILSFQNIVFTMDHLGKKTKYWVDVFIKAQLNNMEKKYDKIFSDIARLISKRIESPQQYLKFSEILSEQEVLSVDRLGKISHDFVEKDTFDSLVENVGNKHDLVVNDKFSIEKERLSKNNMKFLSKISISEGVSIVISKPNVKISSIDVKNTELGLKVIIDIKESD